MHFSLDSSFSGNEPREGSVDTQHVEAFEFGFLVEYFDQRGDPKTAVSLSQGSVNKDEMSFHSILLEVFENNSQ